MVVGSAISEAIEVLRCANVEQTRVPIMSKSIVCCCCCESRSCWITTTTFSTNGAWSLWSSGTRQLVQTAAYRLGAIGRSLPVYLSIVLFRISMSREYPRVEGYICLLLERERHQPEAGSRKTLLGRAETASLVSPSP